MQNEKHSFTINDSTTIDVYVEYAPPLDDDNVYNIELFYYGLYVGTLLKSECGVYIWFDKVVLTSSDLHRFTIALPYMHMLAEYLEPVPYSEVITQLPLLIEQFNATFPNNNSSM